MGGSKRANVYSKLLECGVVICYKERVQANSIGQMKVLGDVTGKDVIIIDDMVDTAGTLCKAADLMISNWANSVRAYYTHAILSGSAYEKIDQSKITELVNRKYTYANLNSNLEDIKTIMRKNKIITLPVIDSNKKILGLIQFYDI